MPRLSLDVPAIEVTDLRKRYRTVEALAGLTMTVGRGEVFGFLGPNGAGKTTTVKLLLGLARPTGGNGKVLDAPLGDLATRRRIGYLPELFRYQPWLKAREVLNAARASSWGCRRPSGRGRSMRSSSSSAWPIAPTTWSDGSRRGCSSGSGSGVALLGEPALVVLDEPTSALDPVGRDRRPRRSSGRLRDRGAAGLPELPPPQRGRAGLRSRRRSSTTAGSSPAARSTTSSASRETQVRVTGLDAVRSRRPSSRSARPRSTGIGSPSGRWMPAGPRARRAARPDGRPGPRRPLGPQLARAALPRARRARPTAGRHADSAARLR